MKSFVIKNAINTCYMDSLLMSLFYQPSNTHNLLLQVEPENINGLYLQEVLRDNFTKKINNYVNIDAETMNLIRLLCCDMGWKNNNVYEYYEQQDVAEFYEFLINTFNPSQFMIEIQRTTLQDTTLDRHGVIEKIPFIPLSLLDESNNNINNMLNNWMFNNMLQNGGGKTIINNYKILNTPYLLPLIINRYTDENNKLDMEVNVDKIIKPNDMNKLSWTIHAIICHNGINAKSGHYYAILFRQNKWYLFDDLVVPSLKEVNICDHDIDDKIKKQSVFLFYKINL